MADHDRRVGPLAQVRYVNFHSHHKHEKGHTDLTEQSQYFQRGGREEKGHGPWEQPAEQRWTKNDSRDDLSQYRRLANFLKQLTHYSRSHYDDYELEQQDAERVSEVL